MKPLVDLVRFPDKEVQLAAVIAMNSIVIGMEQETKASLMTESGIEPLLEIINRGAEGGIVKKDNYAKQNKLKKGLPVKANMNPNDYVDDDYEELWSACIYCLGSLAENDDVKGKLVELGAVASVVRHIYTGNFEIKRSAGYFLATITEQLEYHGSMVAEGALEAIVYLAGLEDVECQEYASFSLAHLASNKDCQVKLVNIGAVRALVSMIASDQEPKHYAGLALLKLADNFENHLKIAEDGGIQALLRLGRSSSTDEQLQYKAALTVGQLASSAVRILPSASVSHASGGQTAAVAVAAGGSRYKPDIAGTTEASEDGTIGHGARMMGKLRVQGEMQKARQRTLEYLDRSLANTQREARGRNLADDIPLALEGPQAAAMTTTAADEILEKAKTK